MKRIVIIDHEPLTIRRKQIFYIDALFQAGFQIKFWDCSQYFHKGMQLVDTLQEPYLSHYDSFEAIKIALEREHINNTLFIVEAFDIWQNRRFFRLLSDKGCYTIRMDMYSTAMIGRIPFWHKLITAPISQTWVGFQNRTKALLNAFYARIYDVKGYNLTIGAGSKLHFDIRINHPDWELYRQSVSSFRSAVSPYVLFIDEYFPMHPDLLYFNKNYRADPAEYRSSLLHFFDSYEVATGYEIVIAAHPKAEYNEDSFKGRKIIKYKTVELIRDAQQVLLHSSAAISFALIFNKPIALITTNGYVKTFSQYNQMKLLSRLFELSIYNIDRIGQPVRPVRVSKELRERYIYDYLTCRGKEEYPNKQLVVDLFSRL